MYYIMDQNELFAPQKDANFVAEDHAYMFLSPMETRASYLYS